MSDAPSADVTPAKKQRLPRRADPLTQLVLTVPVFLIYHLGILFLDRRNGVDLVSTIFWKLHEASVAAYLGVTIGFAVVLVLAALRLRKSHQLRIGALVPLIGESILLAIGMWLVVGWAVGQVSATFAPQALQVTLQAGAPPMSAFAKVVLSCGAGFHEELVFRVLLFGGLILLAGLFTERPWQKLLFAAVISSVLFSLIHYVGSLADTFSFVSFFFRFLAGIYLAAVYRIRGFAVAVYTHAIYDIFVMFLAG